MKDVKGVWEWFVGSWIQGVAAGLPHQHRLQAAEDKEQGEAGYNQMCWVPVPPAGLHHE
jgi:hypothetical protein